MISVSSRNILERVQFLVLGRAEQLMEILVKIATWLSGISKSQALQYLIKGNTTIIKDALWCYSKASAYKSYSLDKCGNACLVRNPTQNTSSFYAFYSMKMKCKNSYCRHNHDSYRSICQTFYMILFGILFYF